MDGAVQQIRSLGAAVVNENIDLSDDITYRDWVTRSCAELGGCDSFSCIGSAGGSAPSDECWQAVFSLDPLATYCGLEAALPALEQSSTVSIVAISTTFAIETAFGPQPYLALKAVVANYAGGLAHSLAPQKHPAKHRITRLPPHRKMGPGARSKAAARSSTRRYSPKPLSDASVPPVKSPRLLPSSPLRSAASLQAPIWWSIAA
ncbi:short chain dehydrogenase [compost metagenome]